MNGDHSSLTGHPIMILGGEELSHRIHTMCMAHDAPFSVGEINHFENYEEAIAEAKENPSYTALFCEIPEDNPAAYITLTSLKDYIPIIVMTESQSVKAQCRSRGIGVFLPLKGLSTQGVFDAIFSADDFAQLNSTNQHLKRVYESVEKRFHDVAEQFADWLWEIDTDLNIVFSSSRKRPAQVAERGNPFTVCFLPEEESRIIEDFNKLLKMPEPFQDQEYWSADAYGSHLCWALSGTPIMEDDKVVGYRGIAKDISAAKAAADQIYHLANKDNLTGLYNRRRFEDELGRMARRAASNQSEGALMMIDIDRFKYVNEKYGHDVGDKLLVHVASLVKDQLRAIDFAGRTGSSEFSIILPELRAQDVDYHVQSLRRHFESNPLMTAEGPISFSTSIGIVRFPEHGIQPSDLMSKIDSMLDQAKEKGRGRSEFYNAEDIDQTAMVNKLDGLNLINWALEKPEERMVLHFQPIVALGTSTKEFYEVLVRMVGEDGELIAPFKFIDAAEEFGLIGKIDSIVTQRAIKLLSEWHAEGRKAALSINLSGRTFDDAEAMREIESTLQSTALPPGSTVFEITETTMVRDLSIAKRAIADLKRYGAQFALDDCGVGYSSLNYIRQLELDYVKIDGSFIRNMHKNEHDATFVKAIHEVAEKMNILTVAEMVENEEILVKLKEIGVNYAQGYYFAIPGPDIPTLN